MTVYKYLFLLGALCSCTLNQQDRFLEMIEQPEGAFHRQKAIHLVRESLSYPRSDLFSLEFERSEELITDKGSFPLYILKGDLLPLEERFVLAELQEDDVISLLYEFEIMENGELKVFTPSGIKFQKEIAFAKQEGLEVGKEVRYVLASFETFDCAEAAFIPEEKGPTQIFFSINKLPDQIDPAEVQTTVLTLLF
jgi:hypothetical protein